MQSIQNIQNIISEYKHKAFISYAHEDLKWAEWLHDQLMFYKFPRSIRQIYQWLPESIGSIFRDKTHLSSGDLSKEIFEALHDSEYLIVICSPAAVASPWVDKEIEEFKKTHDVNNIIPFIVNGVPNSTDNECYPENLRNIENVELLGINMINDEKDVAFVKVIVSMFDELEFYIIWQQWEKKKKNRLIFIIIALSFFTVIVLTFVVILYVQQRGIKKNISRAVAYQSEQLVEQGNSYLARKLLTEVVYDERDWFWNRYPYVPEVESALRLSYSNESVIIGKDSSFLNAGALMSKDSRYVLFNSLSTTYSLWNAETGTHIRDFDISEKGIKVQYSLDSRYVIVLYDNFIKYLNIETGEYERTIEISNIKDLSPDGRLVLTSYDTILKLYDIESKECLKVYDMSKEEGNVYFSRDGAYIVVGKIKDSMHYVSFFDVVTGNRVKSFKLHQPSFSFTYSPDYRYGAIGLNDYSIGIVELESGIRVNTLVGHTGLVRTICYSHDGKYIVSGGSDDTIKLWDVEHGQCIKTFSGSFATVHSALFSDDGRYIIASSRTSPIIILDLMPGKEIKSYIGHSSAVGVGVFSHDATMIASASADNTIKIWDVESQRCINTIVGHKDMVQYVSFSKDDRYLVSASSDNTIKLWEVKTGECVKTFSGHKDCVKMAKFSNDERYIVSASWDNNIKLWDIESGECLNTFEGHTLKVNSVECSPINNIVVSASSDGTIKVWDINTGINIRTINGHKSTVSSVNFSQDGKYLVSAGLWDCTIKIWDVESGSLVRTIKQFNEQFSCSSFSPDGKYIVSASWNGNIRIWDIKSGKCIHTLKGHNDSVYYASFSPNGQAILSASEDKSLKLWDFYPLQDIVNETKERFHNVTLNKDERVKYYLDN